MTITIDIGLLKSEGGEDDGLAKTSEHLTVGTDVMSSLESLPPISPQHEKSPITSRSSRRKKSSSKSSSRRRHHRRSSSEGRVPRTKHSTSKVSSPTEEDECYMMLKAASDHSQRRHRSHHSKKNKKKSTSNIAESYVNGRDTTTSLSGSSSHGSTSKRRTQKGMSVFDPERQPRRSHSMDGRRKPRGLSPRQTPKTKSAPTISPKPRRISPKQTPKTKSAPPKSFAHLAPPTKGLKRSVTAGAALGVCYSTASDPLGAHPLASKSQHSRTSKPPSFASMTPTKATSLRRARSVDFTMPTNVTHISGNSVSMKMEENATCSSMGELPSIDVPLKKPSCLHRAVSAGGQRRGLRRPTSEDGSFSFLIPSKAASGKPKLKRVEAQLGSSARNLKPLPTGLSKSMHTRSTLSVQSDASFESPPALGLSTSNHSSTTSIPRIRSSSRDRRAVMDHARAASMPQLPDITPNSFSTPRRGRRKHAMTQQAKKCYSMQSMDSLPILLGHTQTHRQRLGISSHSAHSQTGQSKSSSHSKGMRNNSDHSMNDAFARSEKEVAAMNVPVISFQDNMPSFDRDGIGNDGQFRRMSFDSLSTWGSNAIKAAGLLDDSDCEDNENNKSLDGLDAAQAKINTLLSP